MTHKLTKQDHLKTIHIQLGDTIEISLDENPTTGYLWEIDANDSVSFVSEYKVDGLSPYPPGQGGVRTWMFNPKIGTLCLDFLLRRPWDQYHVIDEFNIKIITND